MRIDEVADALRDGFYISRTSWEQDRYIMYWNNEIHEYTPDLGGYNWLPTIEDLTATDWFIIKKEEQKE